MTAAYRITALAVKDFKRVRDVMIEPGIDAAYVLIGGDNAQGKTSILDALECLFGGKECVPDDPVRHGAARAELRAELRGEHEETLTITRAIQPDGKTVLEVRDAFGAIKAPQATLDKLIGQRCIDPLKWLSLDAKEQRKSLLRLVDRDNRIPDLDQRHERVFTKRRDVGRDLDKAKGEFSRAPRIDPAAAIDVEALSVEARAIEESIRRYDRVAKDAEIASSASVKARNDVDKIKAEIARLTESLVLAENEFTRAKERSQIAADAATAERLQQADVHRRRAEVAAELKRATEHNAGVASARAAHERRNQVAAEVDKLASDYAELSKTLDDINRTKAEILSDGAMPVEGLTVDAEFVRYGGVPLASASRAEQYRVAIAIAIAANPELADIWIRDGSLFDDQSLEQVVAIAAASGRRLWIERVGARDPGVVIIHDGTITALVAGISTPPNPQQPLFR